MLRTVGLWVLLVFFGSAQAGGFAVVPLRAELGKNRASSLTVTNTTPGGNDQLGVQAAGELTVSASTLNYNGAAIGSFSGGATSTPLVVNFISSATQAADEAVAAVADCGPGHHDA